MRPPPRFQVRDAIRLRCNQELGLVAAPPVRDAGEYWYRIRFSARIEEVVEADLEPLLAPAESLQDLASRGAWGQLQAFRIALAIERITNANQSTVYAFRGQRILFEAFQYKPLLKMLDSPDRRLLIADEVGLGKTIETGLILAELEARQGGLDQVLVVCPSRLRQKWRDEMSRKFGQEFTIASRSELEDYLDLLRREPSRQRMRFVVSMQTLRNEDLRTKLLAEVHAIDLLVVDEAHHARNSNSQTSQMLRELCEGAEAVVLLTATPIHLGTKDLFTLLHALRPGEFRDDLAFDSRLQQFAPIHQAALLVRYPDHEKRVRAAEILRALFRGIGGEVDHPLAKRIIEELDAPPPTDSRALVELERRVQELHPLSSVLTRTRKREVQEHAAIRCSKVYRCKWTPEERETYRQLVQEADGHGWFYRAATLGVIQRARQAASCLPAALRSAAAVHRTDDDASELTDIMPSELPRNLSVGSEYRPGTICFPPRDSKLEQLLEVLREIDRTDPGAKVLIFTFFVGTSSYLQEQLTARGFPALRIAGDVPSEPRRPLLDERGKRMRQFREDVSVRILVSTEVGSEGLDFQFCHHLVNYDLPWNPMVIEQRIGRIDRFGQQAAKIFIWNLVVEGTVEDRILYKLYNRIQLFERSLGPLEAILGEEISKLQRDYVNAQLTPEQDEQRTAQIERAILTRQAEVEELERHVENLLGHEDYIRDQLRRVHRYGRYVSEQGMLALIDGYLRSRHPSVRRWEEPAGIHHLRLTHELRQAIQNGCTRDVYWLDPSIAGVYSFCFDGEHAYHRPEVDLINASHPLVRTAMGTLREHQDSVGARLARSRLVLAPDEDPELPAGIIYLAVFTNTLEGIRARRLLDVVAWSQLDGTILAPETGERLLHLLQERGEECDLPTPGIPPDVWGSISSAARARNQTLRQTEERENEGRYIHRRDLLEAERQHDLKVKNDRLATAVRRGRTQIIPLMNAQIAKAESRYRALFAELERTRNVPCRLSDVMAVCAVHIVRHP